jgi:hypothetical protein
MSELIVSIGLLMVFGGIFWWNKIIGIILFGIYVIIVGCEMAARKKKSEIQ